MQPESHYYTLNVTHYDGAGSVEGIDAVDTRDSNWVDKVLADVDKRDESYWPLYICLLGNFRILRLGQRINMRSAKVEALFCNLAIQLEYCIRREVLLDRLWPDGDLSLASQSLNSLLHKLRKSLSVEHDVSTPNQIPDGVAYSNGYYSLNTEAGVNMDVLEFERAMKLGDRYASTGSYHIATAYYARAVRLYRGELHIAVNMSPDADIQTTIQRERLHTLFLSQLTWLASYHYTQGSYAASLENAQRLLTYDPCREDIHRLVMLCYLEMGQRAKALHQYRYCTQILLAQFAITPEPATTELFELILRDPDSVERPAPPSFTHRSL